MSRRILPALSLLLLAALPGAATASDVTLPQTVRTVLPNGTVVILSDRHEVPLFGFRALLRGGAVTDPPGKAGLAALFAGLLEKGAGERDAAAFSDAVESTGGRIWASGGLESVTIGGDFMAHDAALMVELLRDMLRRPALAEDEFDKLRSRMIDSLRAAKDGDPGTLLPVYADAFLFGEHPYAGPAGGSEESLAAISHDDVVDYYQRYAGGDRLIIVVSGDIDIPAMQAMLERAFADWRAASEPLPDLPAPAKQPGRRVLLVDKPGATQTYFWLGNVGVARGYGRRAELETANTVFGGRFTSMLNTALRVESGLTYGARSVLVRPSQPGSIAISSFTQTQSTVEAIDMAIGVLDQLHSSAIGPEAIDSARNYLLGQFPTALETADDLATQFAELEFYGLGNEYVDGFADALAAVTPESLAAVISDVYPLPEDLVVVLLGDADAIRDSVARYGDLVEIAISDPRFVAGAPDDEAER